MTAIGAAARAVLEVRAGLVPDKPLPAFTRQWFITSAEWKEAQKKTEELMGSESGWNYRGIAPTAQLLLDRQGPANAYAAYLQMQPDLVNWVRTEWVWL